MRQPSFDPARGLSLLEQLVLLTAPPAAPDELAGRGLAHSVGAIGRAAELETLWELAGRLHALDNEEGMLQAALDLVLERLDLTSGWIFWGQSSEGTLGLAASRGIADDSVRRARTDGIGTCLCLDVFA